MLVFESMFPVSNLFVVEVRVCGEAGSWLVTVIVAPGATVIVPLKAMAAVIVMVACEGAAALELVGGGCELELCVGVVEWEDECVTGWELVCVAGCDVVAWPLGCADTDRTALDEDAGIDMDMDEESVPAGEGLMPAVTGPAAAWP